MHAMTYNKRMWTVTCTYQIISLSATYLSYDQDGCHMISTLYRTSKSTLISSQLHVPGCPEPPNPQCCWVSFMCQKLGSWNPVSGCKFIPIQRYLPAVSLEDKYRVSLRHNFEFVILSNDSQCFFSFSYHDAMYTKVGSYFALNNYNKERKDVLDHPSSG